MCSLFNRKGDAISFASPFHFTFCIILFFYAGKATLSYLLKIVDSVANMLTNMKVDVV